MTKLQNKRHENMNVKQNPRYISPPLRAAPGGQKTKQKKQQVQEGGGAEVEQGEGRRASQVKRNRTWIMTWNVEHQSKTKVMAWIMEQWWTWTLGKGQV